MASDPVQKITGYFSIKEVVMKPQNVKDPISVISLILDIINNASLEPELLNKLKVAVRNLEYAKSVNNSKGINEVANEIAKAFLVM